MMNKTLKTVQLNTVATVRTGDTVYSKDKTEEGIPLYGSSKDGRTVGYIKNPRLLLHQGDIIIPARGHGLGKPVVVKEAEAACTNSCFGITDIIINPNYLYYCCVAFHKKWFVFNDAFIPQINKRQVEEAQIPMVSGQLQEMIVGYLNYKVDIIDKAIQTLSDEVLLLEKYRTSVVYNTVICGVNSQNILERVNNMWFDRTPFKWDVSTLGCLIKERKTRNYSHREKNVLAIRKGKVVRRDFSDNLGYIPDNFDDYKMVEKGDIVLRLNGFLRENSSINVAFCREGGTISDSNVIIYTKNDIILSEYLYYVLLAFDSIGGFNSFDSYYNKQCKLADILSLPVPIPTIVEQKEIVEHLNQALSNITELIDIKQQKMTILKDYKQSLIYNGVTGQLAYSLGGS